MTASKPSSGDVVRLEWCAMKRLLVTFAAVVTLATMVSACGGDDAMSAAEGKHAAQELRRPIARSYWQLYNSIGSVASAGDGYGHFEKCQEQGNSVKYTAIFILNSKTDKRSATAQEDFTTVVADRLTRVGWHVKPATGIRRSETKSGITAGLEPSEVSATSATIILRVNSKCVDVGSAAAELKDSYANADDKYRKSRATSSRLPIGFPDLDSAG